MHNGLSVRFWRFALTGHLAALHLASATQQMIETQRTKLVGIAIPPGVSNQLQAALERAIDESFVTGFRVVMLICAALAAASALSALLLIEGKRLGAKQPSRSRVEDPSLRSG